MKLAEEFIAEMRELFSEDELKQLVCAMSKEPVVSIRLNTHFPDVAKKVETSIGLSLDDKVAWADSGYYLANRPSFTLDPLIHAGHYYVQEASSMFLHQAVKTIAVNRPVMVLDLCAAPGGKSTHLISLLPHSSLLVSNEILRARANVLAENITKWGMPGTMVTCNTPHQIGQSGLQFDIILVDAPCSGEGMFRKDSMAISEWSLQNVDMCASRQREILQAVWPALKPGGYLIYSTCTYNHKENEDNVNWIVSNLGASVIPIDTDPNWNITPAYHFFPHKTRGEGFFLSLLKKIGENTVPSLRSLQPRKEQDVPLVCREWVSNAEQYYFASDGKTITAMPQSLAYTMNSVSSLLYPLVKGVQIAEVRGHYIVPSHGLAMSNIINTQAFAVAAVTREQALSYLHGDAIHIDAPLGTVLLTYLDVPLGFVKNIGNRANNLYPKEWRIRMDVC